MAIRFIRICLILSFFGYSGCFSGSRVGGPKVDPPGVTDEARADTTNADDMDSGVLPSTADDSGGAGGRGEDFDTSSQSDTETYEEDDAGSSREL
jgi:hypothetical protein